MSDSNDQQPPQPPQRPGQQPPAAPPTPSTPPVRPPFADPPAEPGVLPPSAPLAPQSPQAPRQPQPQPPQDLPPQTLPPQAPPAHSLPPQNQPPQAPPAQAPPAHSLPPQNLPPQNLPPQSQPPQNTPAYAPPPQNTPQPNGAHQYPDAHSPAETPPYVPLNQPPSAYPATPQPGTPGAVGGYGNQPPTQAFAGAPVSGTEAAGGSKKKTGLIAGGIAGLLALGGIGAFAVIQGGDEEAAPTTTAAVSTTAAPIETTTEPPTTEPAGPPTITELAESTVQVLVLNADGVPTCVGSGTVLDEQGTILTNAHVITPNDSGCEVEAIAIGITGDPGQPPEILYFADLLDFDQSLDLAVLRISSPIDPATEMPAAFTFTELGDSDAVTIGDDIRILGYPTIGGDTITFTNGSVSGFTAQAGVGDRSWIKTDATIAGGNSGGTAINDAGELIGIPTQAAATSDGEIADCRVVTDTNGDGVVDGADQCIPIGGFLNGIRPVNLAAPLIESAQTAAPLAPDAARIVTQVAATVDFDQLFIYRPGFSLDIADPEADTVFVRTAAAGEQELCFWFDWQGLPTGANWTAAWFVDDQIIDEFSHYNQTWDFEPTGQNFWVCATADEGLVAGLYELVFFVEDEIIFIEAIEVTDTPAELFQVEFVNESEFEICYLKVNPLGASDVGMDELGTEETIPIGGSYSMRLPAGSIIVSALNCDLELVSGSRDGIQISQDEILTIFSS